MDKSLFAQADEIVATLPAGRQEMVREIVINSIHRGHVDESARRYLTSATGGTELADILTLAVHATEPKGELEPPERAIGSDD